MRHHEVVSSERPQHPSMAWGRAGTESSNQPDLMGNSFELYPPSMVYWRHLFFDTGVIFATSRVKKMSCLLKRGVHAFTILHRLIQIKLRVHLQREVRKETANRETWQKGRWKWKWIATKQQPSTSESGHQISCCLDLSFPRMDPSYGRCI